jgi:hypothetical protein
MITDHRAHWQRLTDIKSELCEQAHKLGILWPNSVPNHGLSTVRLEELDARLIDLGDEVSSLRDELTYLRGHQEAALNVKKMPSSNVNDRGDLIIDITPDTAPVSEIADSLGTTIPKVNGAVRRLHLKPAGWVYWRLYDGTEPEPAGTYDLAQWKQLKEDLAGHVRVLPPARLLASSGIELEELADEGIQETLREWHSNDSSHYAKHLKGHNNGTE